MSGKIAEKLFVRLVTAAAGKATKTGRLSLPSSSSLGSYRKNKRARSEISSALANSSNYSNRLSSFLRKFPLNTTLSSNGERSTAVMKSYLHHIISP